MYLTFMLPCIVINFLFKNQPDALIIQIYSVIKLYMFRASSLPITRSFLLYDGNGTALQFHPDPAWERSSETCMKLTSAECTVKKTPDDGQRRCPKQVEFYDRINLNN